MKRLLGLVVMLFMSVMTTEVKADFTLSVDSVSTTIIPGYVYVTGHLVDDPDGSPDGILVICWDQQNPTNYISAYCDTCDEYGNWTIYFPYSSSLVGDQIVFAATDWNVEWYDQASFLFPHN